MMDEMPFEEIGPMAGDPWSDEDLELLRKLGILPGGQAGRQINIGGDSNATIGTGPLGSNLPSWESQVGKSFGTSGSGSSSGFGAGAQSIDQASNALGAMRGASSSTSTGGEQKPHDIERKGNIGVEAKLGPVGSLQPIDTARLSAVPKWADIFRPVPAYVQSSYRSAPNPWSDMSQGFQGAQMAQNYIKHMLSRGRP